MTASEILLQTITQMSWPFMVVMVALFVGIAVIVVAAMKISASKRTERMNFKVRVMEEERKRADKLLIDTNSRQVISR